MSKQCVRIAFAGAAGWMCDQIMAGLSRTLVPAKAIVTPQFGNYVMGRREAQSQDLLVLVGGYVAERVPPRFRDGLRVLQIHDVGSDHFVPRVRVTVNADTIGCLAAEHLLGLRCRSFAVFAMADNPFAELRAAAFECAVRQGGGDLRGGGTWVPEADGKRAPDATNVGKWLRKLPRPVGIFACCDTWGRTLQDICRECGARIPDEVRVIGVDDSPMALQTVPPMSSVAVPWQAIGEQAGVYALEMLKNDPGPPRVHVTEPSGVVARRSTDIAATEDEVVRDALAYIHAHAHEPIGMPDILRAVPTYAKALQRAFHKQLGRTVIGELRAARLARAQELLRNTDLPTPAIAAKSGFSSASRLSIVFHKETGKTPSGYRRQFRGTRSP